MKAETSTIHNGNITGMDIVSYIKAPELADAGAEQILFAQNYMPVLSVISSKLEYLIPFEGLKIAICSHITKETAAACIVLKNGGAKVMLVSSNPISTQDDVAAALAMRYGITVCGHSQQTPEEWIQYLEMIFQFEPDILLDDGAEILPMMYEKFPNLAERLLGSTEQTTSGVKKCMNMERAGILKHPIIAVNSSRIKHLFDNYYGVGQSSLTTISNIGNLLFATETVVVIGYGNVGRGISQKAKGLGARVIVCEIDPLKALNAYLEGNMVMTIQEAAKVGTVFITATGSSDVIPIDVIMNMKSGVILSNCGSGQTEIDVASIKEKAVSSKEIRTHMVRYYFDNGKYVHVLTDGRVTNLVGGEGNPAVIMDLTFSAIVLGVEYLIKNKLERKVYTMPEEIDKMIASIKMNEYEIRVSKPTEKQKVYDSDWHK